MATTESEDLSSPHADLDLSGPRRKPGWERAVAPESGYRAPIGEASESHKYVYQVNVPPPKGVGFVV
jgi:hypothetical protein